MQPKRRPVGAAILAHMRNSIIAGIIALVPLALTILVLKVIVSGIDNLLKPAVVAVFKRDIPGLGLVLLIPLLYLIGLVAANLVGRQLVHQAESVMARIPIVGLIYRTAREALHIFTASREDAFKRVVLVEFPRKGLWSLAFLTGSVTDSSGRKLARVYVPTSPNVTTGFMELVDEGEVYDTSLTMEEAIKLLMSGGILSPQEIEVKKRETDRTPPP